jgi:hypothetical protein
MVMAAGGDTRGVKVVGEGKRGGLAVVEDGGLDVEGIALFGWGVFWIDLWTLGVH